MPWWARWAPGQLAQKAREGGLHPLVERILYNDPPALIALPSEPGEVSFPAVCNDSEIKGFLLRIRAGAPGEDLPRDVQQSVWAWVEGVIGAPVRVKPRLTLSDKPVPPEGDLAIEGRSMELAAALAALSWLAARPLTQPSVVSARVGAPGLYERISHAEHKRQITAAEAPHARVLIANTPGTIDLDAWLGPNWKAAIAAGSGRPEVWAEKARTLYLAGKYDQAADAARVAIEAGVVGRCRGLALWVQGAQLLHQARTEQAITLFDQARQALEAPQPSDVPFMFEREELAAFMGVALTDQGRPKLARALLEPILDALHPDRPEMRYAQGSHRWRSIVIQIAGTLHRACVLDGDLPTAASLLDRWSLDRANLPEERLRCLLDRMEVARRTGDPDAVETYLTQISHRLHTPADGHQERTRRFFELYRRRQGSKHPTYPVDEPSWRDWPQPAEVGEQLLGTPELLPWLAKHVPDGTVERMVWSGLLARHLARHPQSIPEPLTAMVREMIDGPHVEPEVGHALASLLRGEPAAWIQRCPY